MTTITSLPAELLLHIFEDVREDLHIYLTISKALSPIVTTAMYSTMIVNYISISRVVQGHRCTVLQPRLAYVKSIEMDLSWSYYKANEEIVVQDCLWLLAHVDPQHARLNLTNPSISTYFERLCSAVHHYNLTSLDVSAWCSWTLDITLRVLPHSYHRLSVLLLRGRDNQNYYYQPSAPPSPSSPAVRDLLTAKMRAMIFPNLVQLELDGEMVNGIADSDACIDFFSHDRFPRLVKLSLPRVWLDSKVVMARLLPQLGGRLKSLSIVEYLTVDVKGLPETLGHLCPRLKVIYLVGMDRYTVGMNFLHFPPNLRHLAFAWESFNGVRSLAESLEKEEPGLRNRLPDLRWITIRKLFDDIQFKNHSPASPSDASPTIGKNSYKAGLERLKLACRKADIVLRVDLESDMPYYERRLNPADYSF